MGHVDVDLADADPGGFGEIAAVGSRIDITPDRYDRGFFGEFAQNLPPSDVPGVEYQIDRLEQVGNPRVEVAVGIGNYPYTTGLRVPATRGRLPTPLR